MRCAPKKCSIGVNHINSQKFTFTDFQAHVICSFLGHMWHAQENQFIDTRQLSKAVYTHSTPAPIVTHNSMELIRIVIPRLISFATPANGISLALV